MTLPALQSKIEFYKLGPTILKMKRAGATIDDICEYCNTKLLKGDNQFISRMSVSRYCQKFLQGAHDQRMAPATGINELNELMEMYDYTDDQLTIAEKSLESMQESAKGAHLAQKEKIAALTKKINTGNTTEEDKEKIVTLLNTLSSLPSFPSPKDTVALMNASEKTLARRQSILANIIEYKEKVLSFIAAQKLLKVMMDKIKEKDLEVYSDVCEEFNRDPMTLQCLRAIPETAAKVEEMTVEEGNK